MPVRVLAVGGLFRELEAEQRDDRRAGVGQIVKCIGSDGDRPADRARKQLERKQQKIERDAQKTAEIAVSAPDGG